MSQTFTRFSRNNILKMNVLLRFIYLLHTLPIRLPRSYLLKFLWGGKEAHLKSSLLVLPKAEGGMGFPDPLNIRKLFI